MQAETGVSQLTHLVLPTLIVAEARVQLEILDAELTILFSRQEPEKFGLDLQSSQQEAGCVWRPEKEKDVYV